ncbi:hypothetical protein [Paenibacillus agricola]|uniref:Uncharacterized protein n=1 Tax=Paenibacillus agricola TaxID=2716264 RepID=A0ABX0JIN1_9BACL|nr:hypothetical protein [Paenibacillus agricola]NHN35478.1 hypothetical protein [Paenibacillus agricola]
MKQVLAMDGLLGELQGKVKDYYRSIHGLVIGESGREATVNFFKYGGIQAKYSIHAVFTGVSSQFIVMLSNGKSGIGSLVIYEGNWSSTLAMSAASRSVSACFPSAVDREHRGILYELGKMMYIVLTEFDTQSIEKTNNGSMAVILTIDQYKVLTDFEWIEDIMEKCSENEN